MNIKELKSCARKTLKRNYFKTLIVVFIFTVIVGGGYTFSSKIEVPRYVKKRPEVVFVSNVLEKRKSVSDIIEDIISDTNGDKKEYKYTRGVIAPFVNNMVESNSVVLGFLNTTSLFIRNKTGNAIVSLITVVILTILYLFGINIIYIGKSRYFLEQRRYKDTHVGRLFFPAKVKRVGNVVVTLLIVNIKFVLWCFTIIGGFIKYYEYRMVEYILAENPNVKYKDAIKLSSQMMKGNKWKTFLLDLSFIGWSLLDLFTFGLTKYFFTNMYREASYAELYMSLRKRKDIDSNLKKYLCDEYLDIKDFSDKTYPDEKYFIKINKREPINIKHNDEYTLVTYVLMFFIFSFVGWFWEVILHLIQFGDFVNRGTLLGPWLPIYGWGGVITLYVLKRFKKRPKVYFIASIILCGILEYFTSWYLEFFKNLEYWNYTGNFLNINGRICLEGLLMFGLGCLAVGYFVGPFVNALLRKANEKVLVIIALILVVLFVGDNVYSNIKPHVGDGITDNLIVEKLEIY